MTKYTSMSAGDMLQAMGDDAQKWAEAFREQYPGVPQDVMFGWFANAIEHSSDVRRSRLIHDDQAWIDHIELIASQRRVWREIDSMPDQPRNAVTPAEEARQ